MSSNLTFTHTAIAALAGLAIASLTTTSLAGVATTGATNVGQAPVTGGSVESIPLALESEDGANSNDLFETPTDIQAPNDLRFDIVGELSKSDSDGACRDVDFYRIEGLAPNGEYFAGVEGDIFQDSHLGLFDANGDPTDIIGPGLAGKILLVADDNGQAICAVSSTHDADFDGEDDKAALPHALCGRYVVRIEQFLFADVNGDSLVDISDVRLMLTLIGSVDSPNADLTNDGIVDAADLRILADTVTDRKAQRLAEKKARKLEQRRIKAERKAARQALKAARKAERAARRR